MSRIVDENTSLLKRISEVPTILNKIMDAEGAQMEVVRTSRRRTRAPLVEWQHGNMLARDRSRSPIIKFSGKAGDAKELPLTSPNKDPRSDETVEDFSASPISSYMSTDTNSQSDTEQETDSFCRKIRARFTDSGEPLDYSAPHPSDPIVLGSSFLQRNPELTFAEGAQLTSTPKQTNPLAAHVYYTGSHVVTITQMDESCELDSGLGTSTDSPQSQRPSEGGILQYALEGILDGQENQNFGEESEKEKNEESMVEGDSNIIDVMEQSEQNNGIMIINDQNEEAQDDLNIPHLDVVLPDKFPGEFEAEKNEESMADEDNIIDVTEQNNAIMIINDQNEEAQDNVNVPHLDVVLPEEDIEAEKNEDQSMADEDNVIDVIGQPEQNNAIMINNDQNEEAQGPVNVPRLDIVLPEREAPAPLLDNIQWYYKRPGMTVRQALADAGVCATEILMDELRFRPDIYHQRKDSWHSKNAMSAGGIREVLLRVGVDDSSNPAYRIIFENLQRFSGTYIFLRHSLDHGNFPPELQFLQDEALKVRNEPRNYNPERAQCLRINKNFNEVILQRAVRAARQLGALAQKMADNYRVEAHVEQAARQVDEEDYSD